MHGLWKGTHACKRSWRPEGGARAPGITGGCWCRELNPGPWKSKQCALDRQALTLFLESLIGLPPGCVISTLSWTMAQSLDLPRPSRIVPPTVLFLARLNAIASWRRSLRPPFQIKQGPLHRPGTRPCRWGRRLWSSGVRGNRKGGAERQGCARLPWDTKAAGCRPF